MRNDTEDDSDEQHSSPIDFISDRVRKVMTGGSCESLSSLLTRAKKLVGHGGWSDYVTITLGKSMRWAQLSMGTRARESEYVSPTQERIDYLDSAGHEIWFTPETWIEVFHVEGDDVVLFVQRASVGPYVSPGDLAFFYCYWDLRDSYRTENHKPILLHGLMRLIPKALAQCGVPESIATDACNRAIAHFEGSGDE